jgi:hypothetical protein
LTRYLSAAVVWLKTVLHLEAKIHIADGIMHPMLADIITQRRTWQRPREKREPYTYEMFATLVSQVRIAAKLNSSVTLGLKAAILDWTRLGTFTGSRIAEVAQTQGTQECISRIPINPASGDWSNDPIAFIRDDFTFYSASQNRMTIQEVMRKPSRVYALHIRFRYDKSPRNAVVRKFVRSSHPWLCPVKAAVSIIARAEALHTDTKFPLGVYKSVIKGKQVSLLRSYQFISTMRKACVDAYPDPQHYMRRHVHRIDSHSNRVTAAVALSNAGLSTDEIAFRLRWKPESVDHYLRDCAREIGRFTEAAIKGSLLI